MKILRGKFLLCLSTPCLNGQAKIAHPKTHATIERSTCRDGEASERHESKHGVPLVNWVAGHGYPRYLTTGRVIDLAGLGLGENDRARLRSRRGSSVFNMKRAEGSRPAHTHDPHHMVNVLTTDAFDPVSKEPGYKIAAVSAGPDTKSDSQQGMA